jgi:hypothetical protein
MFQAPVFSAKIINHAPVWGDFWGEAWRMGTALWLVAASEHLVREGGWSCTS